MKQLVLLAGVALLASCGTKEEAAAPPEVAASDTMPMDAGTATPVAAAGWTGFEPGTYTVTEADGDKIEFVLTATGYTATAADGDKETGTLTMKDGKGCMKAADDGEEMCWTNAKPGADGSWVATADDGSKSTVIKKAA